MVEEHIKTNLACSYLLFLAIQDRDELWTKAPSYSSDRGSLRPNMRVQQGIITAFFTEFSIDLEMDEINGIA